MNAERIALRVVHVMGGTRWIGRGISASLFVLPGVATAARASSASVACVTLAGAGMAITSYLG